MKPTRKKYHLRKSTLLLSFLFAVLLLSSGCARLNRELFGTPPLVYEVEPPKPQSRWTKSPGYSPALVTKIAIICEDNVRGDSFMMTIEDVFIKSAFEKGYKVASRSDVERVMQEIRFQQSGMTEGDAAKLGRLLNVTAVLIVRINGAGVQSKRTGQQLNYVDQYQHTSWCEMGGRLISVEKAEILAIGSISTSRITDRANNRGPAMYEAALGLAGTMPDRYAQ